MSRLNHPLVYLTLGALFGFLLSRAGATQPELIARLFLFEDLHLLWVIASAIVVALIGIRIMQRLRVRGLNSGEVIRYTGKPLVKGLMLGALLFGMGWGLSGVCPGTATTALGEGKLFALFPLAGIFVGTWAYGWWQSRRSAS
ncbi:MAG: YeeE/YedE thiosulfate transporter family protein [Halothiobacillaceae bacterium]|jgi:uncharacterized membrane protein YedE/YeeE|nr:YeeE/YedE thiosulfate transporter family protein [Halothiobacillaceae bacterium]